MTELLFAILGSDIFQAVLIVIATTMVGRLLTARGRLFWSISHQHVYLIRNLDSGNFPVRTQQISVQNFGRVPLKDVEVVLNYPPQHFEIWAPRQYDTKQMPDNRLAIIIPNIAGNETLSISMLDTISELPVVVNVRSESGLGRQIDMMTVIRFPRWVYSLVYLLIIIGISTVCYFLLEIMVGP